MAALHQLIERDGSSRPLAPILLERNPSAHRNYFEIRPRVVQSQALALRAASSIARLTSSNSIWPPKCAHCCVKSEYTIQHSYIIMTHSAEPIVFHRSAPRGRPQSIHQFRAKIGVIFKRAGNPERTESRTSKEMPFAISGTEHAWQHASHSPVIFVRSPIRLKAA